MFQGSFGGVGVFGEPLLESLIHPAGDNIPLAGHSHSARARAAGQVHLHGGPLVPPGPRHVQVSSTSL